MCCIRSGAWQLYVVPVANSQCGGFGSACCRFTSVCLSLEAKSVRFGELLFINPIWVTGPAGRRLSVHACRCLSVGELNNVYAATSSFHTCAGVDEDNSAWSQVYEFVEKGFL